MEKRKIGKLIIAILILIGTSLFVPNGKEVLAASKSSAEVHYEPFEIGEYRSGDTYIAPKPVMDGYEDWIFAGWFKSESEESPIGTKTKTGTYFAKFVPSEVLSVKCQVLDGTTAGQTENSKLRVVSTIDSTRYNKVGFDIVVEGLDNPITYESAEVAKKIAATEGGVDYGYSPNIFDLKSNYFITVTITGIPSDYFDNGFYIKPYWVTKDNTKVYGVERYTRVEDSYLDIVNIPVRLYSDETLAAGSTTVQYDATYFTYQEYINGNLYSDMAVSATGEGKNAQVTCSATTPANAKADGTFAHLRFKKNDTTIFKRNEFAVSLANAEGNAVTNITASDIIYSHYSMTYTGQADTSWFVPGETEFVITSPAELYGFASLVNGTVDGKHFTTEKVYLASDVTVNDAVLGSNGALVADTSGLKNWVPIGSSSGWVSGTGDFKGGFDGQGHTISGLYTDLTPKGTSWPGWCAGLFGSVYSSDDIKDVKVVDSYFKSVHYAGGVVGLVKNGTVDNVYSEATVVTTQTCAGGITGGIRSNDGSSGVIRNSWFKGNVTAGTERAGGIVGLTMNVPATISNCLNEGQVGATANNGGIIGRLAFKTSVETCLNVGTVSGGTTGTIVGVVDSKNLATMKDNYALTVEGIDAIGTKSILFDQGITSIATASSVYGYKALTEMANLDFNNTWVVRQSSTPALKNWCQSDALYTPDTEWAGSGSEKDPWIIKTANELYGLAQLVNAGEPYTGKYFELGANITVNSGAASNWDETAPTYNWIPIGTQQNAFAGYFNTNGNIYQIKGLYAIKSSSSNTSQYVGLFGNVSGGAIQNIKVQNSYLKGNKYVATIGYVNAATVDTVYSDAIVNLGTDQGGGIIAYIGTGTVNNCWFDGSITAAGRYLGGIVGIEEGVDSIENCLMTGSINCTNTSGNVYTGGLLGLARSNVKITDCLVAAKDIYSTKTGCYGSVIGSISDFGTTNVFETTVENVFVLSNIGNTSATVGRTTHNGAYLTGEPVECADLTGGNGFLNTWLVFDRPELPTPTTGDWVARAGDVPALKVFVDSSDRMELVNQNMYRVDTRWFDENKTEFTLKNAEEFIGFESLVNTGTNFTGKKVCLGVDITLNLGDSQDWLNEKNTEKLYKWTPIGTTTNVFQGTFDGDNHTIAGLYLLRGQYSGLFGATSGATVENLRIENSYFGSNLSDAWNYAYMGSVIGQGNGTLKNIYSNAIVKTRQAYTGGFVGHVNGTLSLDSCWFDGTVYAAEVGNAIDSGGFIGCVESGTTAFTTCLYTGSIYAEYTSTLDTQVNYGARIGALVGRVVGSINVNNTLVAGTVDVKWIQSVASNPAGITYVGPIVGRINTATNGTAANTYVTTAITTKILNKNVVNVAAAGVGTNADEGLVIDTTYHKKDNELYGENGKTLLTTLDFVKNTTESVWTTRVNALPIPAALAEDGSYIDVSWYTKGGTANVIDSKADLLGFAILSADGETFVRDTIKLGANIIFNEGDAKKWANNEGVENLLQWTPIGRSSAFAGTFDGQGHTISGLYVKDTATANTYTGFFGVTATGSIVKNFRLTNSCFERTGNSSGYAFLGSIAGEVRGTVDTVYSDAIIVTDGKQTGGIVGRLNGAQVNNALTTATVNKCWYAGEMFLSTSNGTHAAGVVGVTVQGTLYITNSLFTGTITSSHTSAVNVGGIMGTHWTANNTIYIQDCLSAGTLNVNGITATSMVGSVVGGTSQGSTYNIEYAYGSKATANVPFGNCHKDTVTNGTPEVLEDATGYVGYINTNLDFNNTWVAMEKSAPRLQAFAPEEGRLDTESWFNDATEDADGNEPGTQENPYVIDTIVDLSSFAKRVNAGNTFEGQYIKLDADLTFNTDTDFTKEGYVAEYVWTPIGTTTAWDNYDYAFKGIFDGDHNTISGLYATIPEGASGNYTKGGWFASLFGWTYDATIKNIRVEESYFQATNYAAPVVGFMNLGTVDSAYTNAIVTSTSGHSGGVVGGINGATIRNCWSESDVSAPNYAGGIADVEAKRGTVSSQSTIEHCLFSGTVNATTDVAGGILPQTGYNIILTDNLSAGIVTSAGANKGIVVGYQGGTVQYNSTYGYNAGVENGATNAVGSKNPAGTTVFTDLQTVYDTQAYNKLDVAYWTARVGAVPIPSVFAEGDYTKASKVGSAYAIDTELEGNGTEAEPYRISSAAELYGFAFLSQDDDFAGEYVELTSNITINPVTIDKDDKDAVYYDWYPIGNVKVPFAGTFLGNGHTISGLYKAWDAADHWIGLFDKTTDTSRLSDFRIINTLFCYDRNDGKQDDKTKIGGVVGEAYGIIENIYSDVTIRSVGLGTGGIVGMSGTDGTTLTIANCWYNGENISTRVNSSPFMGGIVGYIDTANLSISHCLVSGKILGTDKRVGGLVGSVRNGCRATILDCLFSGDITGGYTVASGTYAGYQYVGQLIGTVECTTEAVTNVTVTACYGVNDYAPYDIGTKVPYSADDTTVHPVINGTGYVSKKYDRLIGYAGKDACLDYEKYWTLMKEGTPVLQYFADSSKTYDGSGIDALLELDYWNSADVTLSKAEDKGQGTYMLTILGSNLTAYNHYLATLEEGIFDAYNNDQSSSLNAEGVYNAVYTSKNCDDSANNDWVVNVTYVDGTIYISIATGQPLSRHLKADSITAYTAEDGYTTSGLTPTFHMLEQSHYSASSYVMQLSNGHFVVIDGGHDFEAPYLFGYLEGLVKEDGKKPIIEAWVLSHGHYDHVGTMKEIVKEATQYTGRVYLEGVYFNEPNDSVTTTYDDAHHEFMGYIGKVGSVLKTTKDKEPEIYRMYTGQRYTFDSVTMDVMLSQELITTEEYAFTKASGAGDAFNETSTWTLFAISDKTLLTMGDASEASKKRIVEIYSSEILTVDVFTAMHHGKNINRLNNSNNDEFSQALTVKEFVLVPYKYDLRTLNTNASSAETGQVGLFVTQRINNFLNKNADAKYHYYGQGTCVLTFKTDNTISATVLPKNDWVLGN